MGPEPIRHAIQPYNNRRWGVAHNESEACMGRMPESIPNHSKLAYAISAALLVLGLAHAPPASAQETALADLSLEELANLPVTSVSKRPEPLANAAAAVYVITNDDIRRTGARTLLGALRLAPNLQVGDANNQTWAIGARGATSATTDKMLVLIDGRIVYSPLFSGTFWDAQNVMLEDVDRIEVVSGPGGTLWGTNAVNGIINIITRKAQATGGTLAAAGGGRHGGNAEARYGGELESGSYRVYGMMSADANNHTNTGLEMPDAQNLAQAGFRTDWTGLEHQDTLQGDAYKRDEDNALGEGIRISGANLSNHWQNKLSGGSDLSVLTYLDHVLRDQPNNYTDREDIANAEFQQALPPVGAQSLTWGASYRYVMDDFQPAPTSGLNFIPASVNQSWESLFAQNETALTASLRGIVGLRLEHNPYTGTETLPNLRLAWNATDNTLLWTAVSRAVRSPSRLDTDLYSPQNPPYFLVGNQNFESEVVKVYEAGMRSQPAPEWSYAVNVYHDYSDNIRTTDVVTAVPLQVTFGNGMTSSTTGMSAWATWKPLDNWRFQAGFSALRESHTLQPQSLPSSIPPEGNDPHNQWSLRSSYDFSSGMELDVTVRHVGALPDPMVPAYTVGTVRLGMDLGRNFELSFAAFNLFGPSHIEFGPTGTAEFGRSYYLRLTWRS
jgi:iron complex outermembrane receptor protein